MNHEKELNTAVELVKLITEKKQELGMLDIAAVEDDVLQMLDCRVFGIPVDETSFNGGEYVKKFSFWHDGIEVMSIHRDGE